MSELTDSERELLAREIALHKWLQTENYGGSWDDDIFQAGWQAHKEYANETRMEQSAGAGGSRPAPTT